MFDIVVILIKLDPGRRIERILSWVHTRQYGISSCSWHYWMLFSLSLPTRLYIKLLHQIYSMGALCRDVILHPNRSPKVSQKYILIISVTFRTEHQVDVACRKRIDVNKPPIAPYTHSLPSPHNSVHINYDCVPYNESNFLSFGRLLHSGIMIMSH